MNKARNIACQALVDFLVHQSCIKPIDIVALRTENFNFSDRASIPKASCITKYKSNDARFDVRKAWVMFKQAAFIFTNESMENFQA